MNILGLEKLSMVDWEGRVVATIFTGGCNYRCPFCHNGAVVFQELKSLDEGEVLGYLSLRKNLLDGVVVTGGEPTLQRDLIEFIEKVRAIGLKVKLDTNGSMPEVLEKVLDAGLVDCVAMDIKNDFEHYDEITGLEHPPVQQVKKSLALLKAWGGDFELRTTLVHEYHKEENIRTMARELKGVPKLYLQKFVFSEGLIQPDYILTHVPKPEAEHFRDILAKDIGFVALRGY